MDIENVRYLNVFLGLGAIILQVFSLLILFSVFWRSGKNIFLGFIGRRYLVLGLGLSLIASAFSLVYSEVFGYAPCALCWYQRVFIFPLPFIFTAALWRRDPGAIKYVFPLLSAGFLVSLYQNFIYYFGAGDGSPCDASGVSCYQQLVSEFGGYISIPMLSLTAFFALLSLSAAAYFYQRRTERVTE